MLVNVDKEDILTVTGLLITADPVSITVTARDTASQTVSQSFAVSVVSSSGVNFPNPSDEIDNEINSFVVTIETEDIPRVPEEARLVSQVYDITPMDAAGDELSGVSATVCLPVAGLARPNRLSVYHYGDDVGRWERLPSALNDMETLVCAESDSFSLFALGFAVSPNISSGLLPPTGGVAPSGWIIWFAAIAGMVILVSGASLGVSALSRRKPC